MSYLTTTDLCFGLSLNKQTAYGTALAAPTASHTTDSDAMVQLKQTTFDDAKEFGKGHGHPTTTQTMGLGTTLGLGFRGSSWALMYALGFAMGKVVTSELAVGVYEHVFTISRELQLPVTTIWQDLGNNWQRMYRDFLFSGFTLSGKSGEHLKIKTDLVGSGYFETSAASIPPLVTSSFLRFQDVVATYGGTDISAQLSDFTLNLKNNVNEKGGYHPGSPTVTTANGQTLQCRGRLLKDGETCNLKYKFLYDGTLDTDELEHPEKAIVVTAEGADIDGTYKHKFQLDVPKAAIKTAQAGKDGKLIIYDADVTMNWDATLASPFKITLVNDIPECLALPA